MRALDRKLLRDLWRLRGQVLAITFVMASGVAVLIMSLAAIEALEETAAAYYERYRFAHVFAQVKRAPERLSRRIAAIEGVQAVETRIVRLALLDMPETPEPVLATLVSVPERGQPALNRLALRQGRWIEPGRPDEIVVGESFAEAHRLAPGDRLTALLNGHLRALRIVGVALSPEYVYAIAPGGLMPDDRRYGVIWIGREALAAAYDLDESFNDVALSLLPGASPAVVIDRLDALLAPYGGTGAIARKDQTSHWFLANEIAQLGNIARVLPTIFIAVAAFLTNIVLARLIAIERSEIGLLKAFGYGDGAIAWHYVKMVLVISALGIALGCLVGFWTGRYNVQAYGEFFRFPFLVYRPGAGVFAGAGAITLAAALAGTLAAVRRAAAMPPAEAMRPPAPPPYRRGLLSGTALWRWLDQPTRIILREIGRAPVRSLLTGLGVAMSVGVLATSLQWLDSIDHLIDTYFFRAQHQDVTVSLVEARGDGVVLDFARMPGVISAEPVRAVRARLGVGSRTRREAIQGVLPDARLSLVYDNSGETVAVPAAGLVLSEKLAELLGTGPGGTVRVEVLEGRRPVADIPVARVFETYIGTPAYMHHDALSRLMKERPSVSAVNLDVDPARQAALFETLKSIPSVAAVTVRQAAVDIFHETLGETILIYASFFVVFSSTLAFGVVYNGFRIALSERGRELATLRVLGFTRFEISYILLGQIGALTILGLPLGCLVGYGLVWLLASQFETEVFRVPLVMAPSTFGYAMATTLAAALLSGFAAWRRLDRLDLIAVLKTRE